MNVSLPPPESTWPLWGEWITTPTTIAGLVVAVLGIALLRWLYLMEEKEDEE